MEKQHNPSAMNPFTQMLYRAARIAGTDEPGKMDRIPLERRIHCVFESLITGGGQYLTSTPVLETPNGVIHGIKTPVPYEGAAGLHVNSQYFALFLKEMLTAVGVKDSELVYVVATPGELFVSKPFAQPSPNIQGPFRCVNPNIVGNVRTADATFSETARACYSHHFGVRVGARVYDPTLQAIYRQGLEDGIDFRVIADPLQQGRYHEKDGKRQLQWLPEEEANAFSTAWLLH